MPIGKPKVHRSSFHLTPVQQVVAVLSKPNLPGASMWRASRAKVAWAAERDKKLPASQILEDGFKRQRRREAGQINRNGNPPRAW